MKTEEIKKSAKKYAKSLEIGDCLMLQFGELEKYAKRDFKAGAEFADKHWQEKTKSNLVQLFSDAEFIENLCFSYRHDFGLLGVKKQILIRLECKEWLRAIINNWKEIEL